jgi:hypothetical protein
MTVKLATKLRYPLQAEATVKLTNQTNNPIYHPRVVFNSPSHVEPRSFGLAPNRRGNPSIGHFQTEHLSRNH